MSARQGRLFEIFDRISDQKQEIKEIKAMYRDALNSSNSYQRSLEELKKLKDEKKKYEQSVKEQFSSEFDKLEVLKNEIANDQQLLSDMVMSAVVKGEKIEMTDKFENEYEPVFNVKFKKIT